MSTSELGTPGSLAVTELVLTIFLTSCIETNTLILSYWKWWFHHTKPPRNLADSFSFPNCRHFPTSSEVNWLTIQLVNIFTGGSAWPVKRQSHVVKALVAGLVLMFLVHILYRMQLPSCLCDCSFDVISTHSTSSCLIVLSPMFPTACCISSHSGQASRAPKDI
jgi:hypothetical protein